VTAQTVRLWWEDRETHGIATPSRARRLVARRAFDRWRKVERFRPARRLAAMQAPRVPRSLRDVLPSRTWHGAGSTPSPRSPRHGGAGGVGKGVAGASPHGSPPTSPVRGRAGGVRRVSVVRDFMRDARERTVSGPVSSAPVAARAHRLLTV
jgi:hypothetical protein